MKIKSRYFSFGLTVLIFSFAFALCGMFPFGDGTVSWCDMNQQGIPMLCNFKDILSGESGFFLNTQNAAGLNFFGVFFFYLSSPFTFLVAFVEKSDIPFLVNILVILKLAVCALTASLFFEKRFPSLGSGLQTVLGLCYAFCGYGMMFFQNIMWLDIMYLFPIVLLGIFRLTEQNKPALLVISLCGCVILNYYISFMVFLFLILFFGFYSCLFKKADKAVILKLGCCAAISLLATAAVWLPSFIQYTSSGRTTDIIKNLKTADFFTSTDTTLPLLFCSGIIFAALFIVVPELVNKGKSIKMYIYLFICLCLPLIIEPVNLMWHTGSYMSFPARYGFMTVFIGLVLCATVLSEFKFLQRSDREARFFTVIIISAAALFIFFFTKKNLTILSNYVQTLWGNRDSSRGLLILCAVAVTAFVFVMRYAKKGLLSRRFFAGALCAIVFAESLCSISVYMISAKDKLDLSNYQSFLALEDTVSDQAFYRVNTEKKFIDANMTGAAGFNSISHYTSLNSQNTMKAMKQFGYSGYWMEIGNWGGSILSDALLSVGYTATRSGNSYTLKESKNFLSLGIFSGSELPETLESGNRLEVLGEVFGNMLANGVSPVTAYQYTGISGCEYSYSNNSHSLYGTDSNAILTYEISVSDSQTLYFDCYDGFSTALNEHINSSFSIAVNGQTVNSSYPSQSNNGLLNLGSFQNTKVVITVTLLKDVSCCSFGVFGIDEGKVKAATENANCLNLSVKGNKISGTVPKNVSNCFISLPYSEGYTVTLNGEKIDYYRALTGFISIYLPNIGGELEITYTPPGFTEGIVISVIGTILLVLFIMFHNKLSALPKKIKNVVYGLFVLVFAVFLCAVYIIPTVISLIG